MFLVDCIFSQVQSSSKTIMNFLYVPFTLVIYLVISCCSSSSSSISANFLFRVVSVRSSLLICLPSAVFLPFVLPFSCGVSFRAIPGMLFWYSFSSSVFKLIWRSSSFSKHLWLLVLSFDVSLYALFLSSSSASSLCAKSLPSSHALPLSSLDDYTSLSSDKLSLDESNELPPPLLE